MTRTVGPTGCMAHPATITREARLKRAIEALRILLLTVDLLVRHVRAGLLHRGAAARCSAPEARANSRNPAHGGNNPADCRSNTNMECRAARLERNLAEIPARCNPRAAGDRPGTDKSAADKDTRHRQPSTTNRNADHASHGPSGPKPSPVHGTPVHTGQVPARTMLPPRAMRWRCLPLQSAAQPLGTCQLVASNSPCGSLLANICHGFAEPEMNP